MRQISAHFFRVIVLLILGLWIFYLLRWVLLPFLIATAVACVAEPFVRKARERLGWPRWSVALLAFFVFLSFLAAAGYCVAVYGMPGMHEVLDQLPREIQLLLTQIFGSGTVHVFGRPLTAAGFAADIQRDLQDYFSPASALRWASAGAALFMGSILTVVLVLYFLLQGSELVRGAIWLVPPQHRPMATVFSRRLLVIIWRYVGGMAVVVAYAAILTWLVALFPLHIKHAGMLALAVGFLELIPIVGPTVSALLIGAIAVARANVGALLGFGAFAFALRLSIDQFVGPLVLGKAVRIPAPLIIFAMLVGGAIWGVTGVLVAVPFAAAVRVALELAYEEPTPTATSESSANRPDYSHEGVW